MKKEQRGFEENLKYREMWMCLYDTLNTKTKVTKKWVRRNDSKYVPLRQKFRKRDEVIEMSRSYTNYTRCNHNVSNYLLLIIYVHLHDFVANNILISIWMGKMAHSHWNMLKPPSLQRHCLQRCVPGLSR